MTELSGFWTTGGTVGDQQTSYTQAQWSTAARILSACAGFEGVAPGYLNSLAGTVSGANTVAIDTGGAMVDGKWFLNDASQDVNIPSASGGGSTRIDRIVLRATWASFNVSVTRVAGTDAVSPTAPAVASTSGTSYDIKLYQALVDTGGTVTITDERQWASHPVVYRQGGSATIWSTTGTTNYVPTGSFIQCGTCNVSSGGYVNVTFPKAYSYAPVVFTTAGSSGKIAGAINVTTSGVRVTYEDNDGTTTTGDVFWMAIGPA